MKPIPTLSTLATIALAPFAIANTPLLINTDFSVLTGDDLGWRVGYNSFDANGNWVAFINDAYTVDDRVDPAGAGFTMTSYDDGNSDKIESFLMQEFNAGPETSAWPTIFSTGDVLVFKGSASATRAGNDPSDMIVRAFIKTLGYNDLGWEFQAKAEYTANHDIGSDVESFELRVTYPDIMEDDSLQVIQIGFEITNAWDGSGMDSGSITFQDIEAYIEATTEMWNGFEVLTGDDDGWTDTGSANLGWLYIRNDPYIYSLALDSWFFMPPGSNFDGNGNWLFVFKD